MIINYKQSAGLILLLLTFTPSFGGDSLKVNSFNSIRLIESDNNWLRTGNSAGMIFNEERKAVTFQGGMNFEDGGFHRIMEASEREDYFFTTESYQKLNDRIFLYGWFAYHNLDEKGALWNGTYDPYRGNPYIIGDSVSGATYHKEKYELSGKMAYKLSQNVFLGSSVSYYVAMGAKQKDPRPENTVTMVTINPSLLIHKEKFRAGIDLGYTNRKEFTEYIEYVSENTDPTFFMFKGFGLYNSQIGIGTERHQSMNEFFGGLQLEKKIVGIPFLTEFRFNGSKEEIEDGSSIIKKEDAGGWNTWSFDLNEQLAFDSGLKHHRIKASFGYFSGDGIEHMQDIIYEDKVPQYITVAKYLKFNREIYMAGISYDYRKMMDHDRLSWILKAGMNFKDNSETYYYVPETFTSSFSDLKADLNLQKDFYGERFHYSTAVGGDYRWNLSKDMLLSDDPGITQKQRVDIYQQEFDYYTSELFRLQGKLAVGYQPRKLKNIDEIYLDVSYNYCKQVDQDEHFGIFSAKLGFVF
ncbi:MAG: DUF6850 family outer membrane beta-barrel protein [Mangrovibacterium sp.]